jgi:hypothetical protein
MNRRGQIWSMDFVVGITIFLVGFLIFYFYSLNNPLESKEIIENLEYDGKLITNFILSEGSPTNWNLSNVLSIGILTDGKISDLKLEYFYFFTKDNYSDTKIMFNTKYDYIFFVDRNMTINGSLVDYIGKPFVNKSNIDAKNLIKITRFTSYRNMPTTAYLYIWEEN